MSRMLLLVLIFSLALAGCDSTRVFEASLFGVQGTTVQIGCSDEINKGKKNVDDVGYICEVEVGDRTAIVDSEGSAVAIGDITAEAKLKIELTRAVNLKKKRVGLPAKKITWLHRS